MRVAEAIDALWPFAGKCGFCGFHDRRHRFVDALRSMHRGGDSAADLARDFEKPVAPIRVILKASPQQIGASWRRTKGLEG